MRRLWFLLALVGCGDNIDGGGRGAVAPLFVVGANTPETFYDLPFPNDLRRTATGLDLAAFPTNAMLVDQIRDVAQELDGFGLNSAIYVRFTGAIDDGSLPAVAASLEESAAVYLVNVEEGGFNFRQRIPVVVSFKAEGTQTAPGPFLVARPYPGFPLDEGTTYALVVTTRVTDESGAAIGTASGFADVLASNAAYAPLRAFLDEAGGDERANVAAAAVFTTQTATNIGEKIMNGVYAQPAPVAMDVVPSTATATYQRFSGTYLAPNFQEGEVPYKTAPAGRISIDAEERAVVQRMEPMRFALTVPPGPVPANGWPICIYQHGTGGSYTSFIGDGTASALAAQGIAVISTDQVLHGPRNPGGSPDIDFFNFGNAYAARDNPLQGAADAWSQLRLAVGLSITDSGRTHTFDGDQVFFFGHSQGGNTGPAFVTFERSLKGAVLSGTAGLLYENLLHKTEPLDIPSLVATVIRDEPVDADNPSLALAQMWIDRSDGVNYAPRMVRHRPSNLGPLPPINIFHTEGFVDTYSPNVGIEAFATALGGDIVMNPDMAPVEGLVLRGRTPKAIPVQGNLEGVTAVLAQYKAPEGRDGHFVVFDVPLAEKQAAEFLGTLARTGTATVVGLSD